MQRYLFQRVAQTILTLVGISIIVFGLARLTGDPVKIMAPPEATAEDIERLREHLGLTAPLPVQYWRFVGLAIRGDFGESIRWQRPALGIILERFPATVLLSASSMLLGLALALPIGVLSAVRRGTAVDAVGKVVALIGQSMPTFWLGILLILGLALYLPLFPTSGFGTAAHLVLPSITLGGFVAASIMRVTRSAMLDVLDSDYIRTARSKGLSDRVVIWKHALSNAAIPVLTITALQTATVLRGAVVTETVFAWPGVGKIAVDAVYARDFPLVQAAVLFMGAVFTGVNLLADLLYARLDPRIGYGRR
ncbi:MAG: ABC transporter permease [Candidatus Rokubacteria bacterium]|nr:ABC transporter permease [Candidatus Rokubacteria bacterium]MBI3108777.1 ABC transporter permease [Candidatus Rokubacteria bacterium]